jgi:hypothetical protein
MVKIPKRAEIIEFIETWVARQEMPLKTSDTILELIDFTKTTVQIDMEDFGELLLERGYRMDREVTFTITRVDDTPPSECTGSSPERVTEGPPADDGPRTSRPRTSPDECPRVASSAAKRRRKNEPAQTPSGSLDA